MGEHVILNVDELSVAISVEPSESFRSLAPREASCSLAPSVPSSVELTSGGASREEENALAEAEEPLIQTVECRICQEEDHINNLDTPCACNGTLKYAHRTCVQRWCYEKGDRTCEICLKRYKPGFVVAPRANPDETRIAFSGGWTPNGTPMDHREPRIVALSPAQQHALEVEIEQCANANALDAAFFRYAALTLFLLKASRYLLLVCSVTWAFITLNRGLEQEPRLLSASDAAYGIQSRRRDRLRLAIASGSATTQRNEP